MKEEPTMNAEAEKEGTKKDRKWHCRGRRCGKLGLITAFGFLAVKGGVKVYRRGGVKVSHLVCEEGGPWAPFLGCGLNPLGRSLEALLVCLSAVSCFA